MNLRFNVFEKVEVKKEVNNVLTLKLLSSNKGIIELSRALADKLNCERLSVLSNEKDVNSQSDEEIAKYYAEDCPEGTAATIEEKRAFYLSFELKPSDDGNVLSKSTRQVSNAEVYRRLGGKSGTIIEYAVIEDEGRFLIDLTSKTERKPKPKGESSGDNN